MKRTATAAKDETTTISKLISTNIKMIKVKILGLALLAAHGPLVTHARVALPSEFSVVVVPTGPELVWTPAPQNATADGEAPSSTPLVSMGGSRYEFRLPSGKVVGYPRESLPLANGTGATMTLFLPFTPGVQEQLATDEAGSGLQVWTSGRRIDARAPPLNKAASVTAAVEAGSVQASGFVNDTTFRVTSTPTTSVNPAARGAFRTKHASYDVKPGLNYSEFPALLEVVGEVTYPSSGSKFPLVLFLHGRHATCYSASDIFGLWPCPADTQPIPSHLGYQYIANILASQGFVVVSIAANGINAQDYVSDGGASARSLLIRHHLLLWSRWNSLGDDPWGGLFKSKVDMRKVVLVGHSRGGEGINRAAIDVSMSDPFTIVGLVSYGPTAFGFQVQPDIHSATILPTCDGDVSDLQGQVYVDYSRDIATSSALRSAIIALGANHNYFNTEWTPGFSVAPSWDDWWDAEDPVCGSNKGLVRLTPAEQQKVGAAYTLALVRLAVKQDAAMLPLLDGSFIRPAAIGRAEVAINSVGGAAYRVLYRPESSGSPSFTKGMEGGECRGNTGTSEASSLPLCKDGDFYACPHWLGSAYHPARKALELRWDTIEPGGATATFPVSTSRRDLSLYDHITVRVANDAMREDGAQIRLMVRDSRGHGSALNTSLASIEGWPGAGGLDRVHARAFRGSLASVPVSRVDLKNISAILLVAKTPSGRVWVLDVAATKSKLEIPQSLKLPKLRVESLVVNEGDGPRTAKVRVLADKPLASPASVWLERKAPCGPSQGSVLSLFPGTTKTVAEVPFSWIGDSLYAGPSYCLSEQVTIGAISGAIPTKFSGGITIEEDEAPPILTVVKTVVQASEGTSLEWKMVLSGPTAGFDLSCYAIPAPRGRAELKSNDVPTSWLQKVSWSGVPSTPTRLSELSVYVSVKFDYGSIQGKLVVPIARDGAAEGDEWVSFQCFDVETVVGGSVVLYGKVSRNR